MKPPVCNEIVIRTVGDRHVGIFPATFTIRGPAIFDLGCFMEEDRLPYRKDVRDALSVAFEFILGEPVQVEFDFERDAVLGL